MSLVLATVTGTGGTLAMLNWIVSLALGLGPGNIPPPSLTESLRILGLTSALVLKSQAVDEFPVWSPDGKFLAVNVDEKWSKIELETLSLRKGTWHDGEGVGLAEPPATLASISESQVRQWETAAIHGARRVATKTGTVAELQQEGLGTLFRITRKDQTPVVLWRTSLENCHSLALAPDESLVAFVCELNGVVVTSLKQRDPS